MRLRLLLLLLCVALVFPTSAVAARSTVDRGLILRVRPPRLLLRELDGSKVPFVVDPSARITLNGRRVRLGRLQRGDVAIVVHDDQGTALAIRAFRP
jgi:hypothetical protein